MQLINPSRYSRFLAVFGCCALLTINGGWAKAEDPARASSTVMGVPSLFDGKSLGQWEVIKLGGEGKVEINNGAITLERGEPITSIVWKGAPLPKVNYEYSMQARRVDGNDFFATVTFPVKDSYCSLVLGGWGGGLIGLSSLNGADASENETTDYFSFEKDRWYKIRIRVTEERIQAWIDEKEIVNVVTKDHKVSVRIEMELSKPLGISTFQTTGEVRNLQIKLVSDKDNEKGKADK